MYTATSPLRPHGMQRDRLTLLPLRVPGANITDNDISADMDMARNVFWKNTVLRVCTSLQFVLRVEGAGRGVGVQVQQRYGRRSAHSEDVQGAH